MPARVSIMIPAYNAAGTLPMALASLASQTFHDWEAIIVDDGSTDGTSEVVHAFAEPRIKLMRLPTNRGRPYARHVALEAAQGSYLCMLDADDWMYPERLARQVDLLDRMPQVGVVSAGMAIVDASGAIVGARGFGEATPAGMSEVFRAPRSPPIPHAPSMLRREVVGSIRPDARLARGQDTDFMLRVLDGNRYFLMPELLYAYYEGGSFTRENVLLGHRCSRVMHRKYFASHPIKARLSWCRAFAKGQAVRLLFAVGREDYLLRSRSRVPTPQQRASFELARREVLRWQTRLASGVRS
jgi:glycosyltransferase involved in cell wall biosynthesis